MAGRALFVDFDLYTDGDNSFKKELITLMIDNFRELKHSLNDTDLETFKRTCHKIKPTLEIIDDKMLADTIHALKQQFANEEEKSNLDSLCTEIIKSLEEEREK